MKELFIYEKNKWYNYIGKSSFIEKFGIFLLENQNHSAVDEDRRTKDNNDFEHPSALAALCIDPSSTLTGGSILGDKTRMADLSRHPKVRNVN